MKGRSRTITGMKHVVALLLVCGLAPAGCSVWTNVREFREAEEEGNAAEAAVEQGDYDGALKSYLRARGHFDTIRGLGYGQLIDEEVEAGIDTGMRRLRERAEKESYVRVGDGYLRGEELGAALGRRLADFFSDSYIPRLPRRTLVPESIAVDTKGTWDGKQDVRISVAVNDTEGEKAFLQDAWAIVRFLCEGAYGYGFAHYTESPFSLRPWMGRRGMWGYSDGRRAKNVRIDLEDKIANLTVEVYRGHYLRGEEGARSGAGASRTLEMIGPHWERSFFRSYAMNSDAAGAINWDRPEQVPDSTLFDMMTVTDRKAGGGPESE